MREVRRRRRSSAGYLPALPALPALFALAGALAACASNSSYINPPPPQPTKPNPEEIEATVFLIGDAGEPRPDMARVLETLAADAALRSSPESDDESRPRIVFLGDNVYESGFPAGDDPEAYQSAVQRIAPQLEAVGRGGAIGIFTAGNHDWDRQGPSGWEAIGQQTEYVESHGALMLPKSGCPGPSVHNIGDRVSLILLDTQWWLHRGPKPRADGEPPACDALTQTQVVDQLRAAVDDASAAGRDVIVAGHHPLESGGRHGGYWEVSDYFLLPGTAKWIHTIPAILAAGIGITTGAEWLLGVAVGLQVVPPLAHIYGRKWIASHHQDLSDSWYRAMRDSLRGAFEENPPLIFAAGHEHNLQVLKGEPEIWNLVSGAGSPANLSAAKVLDGTICKEVKPGYMRLDFLRGQEKQVLLTLMAAEGRRPDVGGALGLRETCRMYLKNQP